jgi:hypothetical protein
MCYCDCYCLALFQSKVIQRNREMQSKKYRIDQRNKELVQQFFMNFCKYFFASWMQFQSSDNEKQLNNVRLQDFNI